MTIFGWSLPPGCHTLPGEEPEGPCDVCGQDVDYCICPECSECGSVGDITCYIDHGLRRSEEQKFLREITDRQLEAELKSYWKNEEALDRLMTEEPPYC